MSGRHRSEGRPQAGRRGRWVAVGVGAAAVVGAAVAVVVATNDGEVSTAGADPARESCASPITVTVAAAPAIAPVVQEVLAGQEDTIAATCARVEVVPVDSPSMAAGTALEESPVLWVADSSLWADSLADRGGEQAVKNLGSMAASPLVFAATPAAVQQLSGQQPSGPVEASWKQVLAGTTPVALVDPEASTEGLVTLTSLETLLGGEPGADPPLPLVQSYVALSRGVVPTVDDAFALTANPATSPVFVTTEQSVLERTEGKTSELTPVYPAEGAPVLDYPVLRLTSADEPTGTREAAQQVAAALLSARASQLAQAAGFRPADGTMATTDAETMSGVPIEPPPALPAPGVELAQDALRTWSAVTLEARMLTVIDVSGSMDQDAGNGRTRIELARDAALAALRLYPDTAQIGLWAFSELKAPPADWLPLVEVGPLGDSAGERTRREELYAQATALPTQVGGGTGLYDTVLAASRSMRAGYDPSRVNSVVLLTDGRNEDDDVGIDLPTLLQTLRAEFDPAQPISIITIGMGPDADVATLQQISELTGGKAYQALDPADIQTVFLDAMVERRCRPNCPP